MKGALLGSRVVGLIFKPHVGGGGRSNESGKCFLLLSKIEGAQARFPVDIRASQRGRPLKLEITLKYSFYFERLSGFDFEPNHRCRLVDRDKERLPDCECVARVHDCAGLGARWRGPRKGFSRQRVAFNMENEMEGSKDF